MQVQRINNNPSFGVVKYNKAGFERLNKQLGSNAKVFIESQSSNNSADIVLLGNKVKIQHKNQFYEVQNYCKRQFNEHLLDDNSHFIINDGNNDFDIFPTDYPLYLKHLINHWITVPFKLAEKRGIFVTNTNMQNRIDYGPENIEYSNAQEMASHIDKFVKAKKDVIEQFIIEDKSWAEAYKNLMGIK